MLAKHLNAPTIEEVTPSNRWTPEAGWAAIGAIVAGTALLAAAVASVALAYVGKL